MISLFDILTFVVPSLTISCFLQSKTIAEQKAEELNKRIGYVPPTQDDKDSKSNQETFKRYEEELEINDFPQTARWKVTSKVSDQKL